MSAKDMSEAAKNTFKYLVSIVFFGGCFAYAFVFRKYKQAVEKHQKLTDLFQNPKARVATGEQAK